MNEPIVLGYYFEIKMKPVDSQTAWEDYKPTLVICQKDSPLKALQMYVNFLLNEDIDLTFIREFRVNRYRSSQGHYFFPSSLRESDD
jgi:hypothetical protein